MMESREDYEKRKAAQRRFWSSLDEIDWGLSFDTLKVTNHNRVVIQRLNKWKPEMQKGGVLFGPVGTGKSTLMKCLINKWASENYRCKFVGMGKLLQKLRDGMKSERTLGEQMAKLVEPDLLIVDDIGVEKPTDWSREQIFTLLEDRRGMGKVNFFTTNLNQNDIAAVYGDRIADRLREWCVWIEVAGPSWRRFNQREEW